MNQSNFTPSDLDELGAFLDRAQAIVPMCEIDGPAERLVIGMRHDVDNHIEPAVKMAQWEAGRGYRSTYFILHTAPYWDQKGKLKRALAEISECGHEIGFHLNAITEALTTGDDPIEIAARAVGELRELGYPCKGVVAHGDQACYQYGFINDELFTESRRPDYGKAERWVGNHYLRPITRKALGFEYDPNWLPRGAYLSDSGGKWSQPFDDVVTTWPDDGQLHMLVHPDWWDNAFHMEKAVA